MTRLGYSDRQLRRGHGPMVITMRIAGMMQVALNQVIHVLGMRHGFVAATGCMFMGLVVTLAGVLWCASYLVGCFRNLMFIDVPAVHMMQMSIVQVIHMPFVLDCLVPTLVAVLVFVV
jgi:hypothetical protein